MIAREDDNREAREGEGERDSQFYERYIIRYWANFRISHRSRAILPRATSVVPGKLHFARASIYIYVYI